MKSISIIIFSLSFLSVSPSFCQNINVFKKCSTVFDSVKISPGVDTSFVKAVKLSSIRLAKDGVFWRELKRKDLLNVDSLDYCAQIIVKGCTDTLIVPCSDNSQKAFRAVSKSLDDYYTMRILTYPITYKYRGNAKPLVIIDRIYTRRE